MRVEDLEALLIDLGFEKRRVINNARGANIMVCCPFHEERNPSCGISADKEIGGCFTCGTTFTLPYFVSYVKGINIIRAKDYLDERFNVSKKTVSKLPTYKRYEEEVLAETRNVLSRLKLAPYKSGKIVHNYLLSRGFTKASFKEFMLGWDSEKSRITIPVFWGDNELAGFLGRAVLEPKINGKDNPEYKAVYHDADKYLVYEFEKSKILYPLNKFELPSDKSVILVEGTLDAIWMHILGFKNTLAILGSKISQEQIELLSSLGVRRVINFLDNDKAGMEGIKKVVSLGKRDFIYFTVEYPEGKNDPQNLDFLEVSEMLENKKAYGVQNVKRLY